MHPSAISTTLHATSNEDNLEFDLDLDLDLDLIAAATEAAVESSVAYVLGMRSHEEDFDFDFEYDLIAAAIHATVEKELREATEEVAGVVAQSRIATTLTQPSMTTTTTSSIPPVEEDYEFEFLESLAEFEAEDEAAATSFTVYPSVPPRATTSTDHPRVGKRSKYFCFF